MMAASPNSSASSPSILSARAVVLGERIDTAGLERSDALSAAPLSFRAGEGLVVVFRYGVVVMIGLAAKLEDETLRGILPRVQGALSEREEESIQLALRDDEDEGVGSDGVVRIGALAPDKLLVVADALAKSAALAQDERQVAQVFDTVEPWARQLAHSGASPGGRRDMLRLIGSALLVQHRLASGWRSVRSPTSCGSGPTLSACTPDLKTNMNSSSEPKPSPISST